MLYNMFLLLDKNQVLRLKMLNFIFSNWHSKKSLYKIVFSLNIKTCLWFV
jgi:hypothetical protein